MKNECKRCLLLESAQGKMLDVIKEKIEKLSPEEKASSELYEFRLSQCRECDSLLSGTCLKCGCYPEFRAAFKNTHCPDGKSKKW